MLRSSAHKSGAVAGRDAAPASPVGTDTAGPAVRGAEAAAAAASAGAGAAAATSSSSAAESRAEALASFADGVDRVVEFLTWREYQDLQQRRRRRSERTSQRRLQDDEADAEGGDATTQCEPCVCDAQNATDGSEGGEGGGGGGTGGGRLRLRLLTTQRSFAQLQVMLEQIAEDYTRQLGPGRAPLITVVGVPSLAEMEREVKFDVRTRAGQFDGYIITPLWIGELADGLFELTDFIRDYGEVDPNYWTDILLFYREVISSYDGGLYLFPFDGDVISMFYRRDLLEKYEKDVPRTWDEYNELAKFFHGKVEPLYVTNSTHPEGVFVKNVTLSGSCIGRTPACGNPYWAQTVLATMTQVRGTYEGSLLDSADLSPLLGPAMEETLRLLGEQTLLGVPQEFDGCVGVHVDAMNAGECVLTYNWGNSFSDHVRPGSFVRGKLGVAPHPGSPTVLNRQTGELEECDPDKCPHSVLDERTGKYINLAPYGAYGGFSGAVSRHVSPENRDAAAQFFAFATSSKKAIKYVIPDADNPDADSVPTGMDPYARSMLVVEEWTSRGFDRKGVEEYKYAVESQLGSENVVMDIRFPRAADFMAALDDVTTRYCNDTKWNELGEDPAEVRREGARWIAERWREIEADFDGDEGRAPGALLEIYQRNRGVYVPADSSAGTSSDNANSLSTGAIVGIAVGVSVGIGLLTLFVTLYVINRERRVREEQWYIDPADIVDTKEVLGRGSFGVVTKGFLRGTPVALKHPLGYQPDKDPGGGAVPIAVNGDKAAAANDDKTAVAENGDKAENNKADNKEEAAVSNDPASNDPQAPVPNRLRRTSDGSARSGGESSGGDGGGGTAGNQTAGNQSGPPERRLRPAPSVSSIEINPMDASVGASLLTQTAGYTTTWGRSKRTNTGAHGEKKSSWFNLTRQKDKDPLRAELLTLVKLRHDNIVQTLGATIFASNRKKELVLVLQYMQNNTVRSILKDPNGVAGTAGMALEIQWALQVARGMGFLHSVPPPAGPMLHNDLKSSNVLVDGSYNAHISDFGLATKTMGGLWGALKSSTSRDAPRGSLLWMAPEVLNGGKSTPESDVYSYSMFLAELMTRTRPFGIKAYESRSGRWSGGTGDDGTYQSRRFSEVSIGTEWDHAKRLSDQLGGGTDKQPGYSTKRLSDDTSSSWRVGGSGGGGKDSLDDDNLNVMTPLKETGGKGGGDDPAAADESKEEKGGAGGAENDEKDKDGNKAGGGEKPKFRRRVSWSGAVTTASHDVEKSEQTAPTTERGSTTNRLSSSDLAGDKAGKGGNGHGDKANNAKKKTEFYAFIDGERLTRDDIVSRVKDMSLDPPFRPTLPSDAPQVLRDICVECWHKNPKRRPTMKEVEERLSGAFSAENVTQQMMRRGSVFDTILPRDVQDALARGESVPPKSYDDATVIFSDIVGFTNISAALTAEEVGDLIRRLFTQFDKLCRTHGVKKLDVIGDAFLGVVGVPETNPEHAGCAARFALGAIAAAKSTMICPAKPDLGYVQVRFGLASGGVVATVIGSLEHPKYTLFGDTVNTASRMESSGMPNRCQCTPATAELVRVRSPDVRVKRRGVMEIKGKGEMETFWLDLAADHEDSDSDVAAAQ